jgi:hypothetical protein
MLIKKLKAGAPVKRGITPAARKAKGRGFEKHVVRVTREALALTEDDIRHSHSSGNGRDVELLSERARNVFGFWVEAKNHKTWSLPAWLGQVRKAQAKAGDESPFVIVFKEHRGRAGDELCVIKYKTLLDLLKRR